MSEEKKQENTAPEEPKAETTDLPVTQEEAKADNPKEEKTDENTDEKTPTEDTPETVERPDLRPGLTIRVHQKIKDVNAKGEEKERIQVFEGIIIAAHKKKDTGATITVRKISNGVGVEKIFPIHLPTIVKWEVVKESKVRRAKLYFLREYKKRLKEVKTR